MASSSVRSAGSSRGVVLGIVAAALIALPWRSSEQADWSPCDGGFVCTVPGGLWDLSGTLSALTIDLGDLTGVVSLDVLQDPKGKIAGLGDFDICVGEGECCEGTCTIKGTVKRTRAGVKVVLTTKIILACEIDEDDALFRLTHKIKCDLDEGTRTLRGTSSLRGSVSSTAFGRMSLQRFAQWLEEEEGMILDLDTDFEAPLEGAMDGTGTLAVQVEDLGKKLVGSATLELSNGKTYAFGVTGKTNLRKGTQALKLKGDPLSAKGLSWNLVVDCAADTALLKGTFIGGRILEVLTTSSP